MVTLGSLGLVVSFIGFFSSYGSMWSRVSFDHAAESSFGKPGDTSLDLRRCGDSASAMLCQTSQVSRRALRFVFFALILAQLPFVGTGVQLPTYYDLSDPDDYGLAPASEDADARRVLEGSSDVCLALARTSCHRTSSILAHCSGALGRDSKPLDDIDIGPLVTLLEAAKDDCADLVCQFALEFIATAAAPRRQVSTPLRVSLAQAIPCTPFQDAVGLLREQLPTLVPVDFRAWNDWLDYDLSPFHTECAKRPSVWAWLSAYGSWYDAPFLPQQVKSLKVYFRPLPGLSMFGP